MLRAFSRLVFIGPCKTNFKNQSLTSERIFMRCRLPLFLFVMAIVAITSQNLFAANSTVGLCAGPGVHYTTISAAVTAAAPSSTITICPNTYPEQVTITKNLTLKGVSSGNQGAPIITSPSGGLTQTVTGIYGDTIEAQIFVQGATVTISDLTVDAANSNLDSLGCSADPVGIYYQNASGTITRNSVVNDVLSPSLSGCQGGLGILAESTGTNSVTITNNNVQNYQKNGITVDGFGAAGLTTTISLNTITGQGPTSGAAENSIQVAYGATGTIANNKVGSDVWAPDQFGDTGDAAAGILIYASPNVAVTTNTVTNTQYGIAIVSDPDGTADGAQVKSNIIATTHLYDGIDLCSNGNTAASNTINGSDEAAVHVDDTCTGTSTGNTVQKNIINSACAGVLSGPASGSNTIGTNTYYNTINLVVYNSDTCTTPNGPTKKRNHARFRPAKP
jgi:hypothetical protein